MYSFGLGRVTPAYDLILLLLILLRHLAFGRRTKKYFFIEKADRHVRANKQKR